MNKLIRLATLMALFTSISCCASVKSERKDPGDRDYPFANQAAAQYFVLSGDVDAAMKIRMSARWVAKNPDCSVSINWLAGIRGPFYTDIPLKLTWSGTHYTALVYFDAILPGRCDYSFKSVVVSGVDSRGQVIDMADWRHPAPDEKSYSDPDVWADLVILTTQQPLPEKDRSGVRNLICTTSYDNPYRPHVLQCGAKLVHPGWGFDSKLWITPATTRAQVNFHYQ